MDNKSNKNSLNVNQEEKIIYLIKKNLIIQIMSLIGTIQYKILTILKKI